MNRSNKEKSKGITLVSLVVTVIVLIIITSISVRMTIGDNGVIDQAEGTKSEVEETLAFEEIKNKVSRSGIVNGKKDYSVLKTNLEKSGITGLYNEEIYPIYIKYKGYDYKIDKNWNVSKGREIVYEASNLTFNGTSDYIDTGIRLFNEENFDKDFQIRFVVSGYGNIRLHDTIVNVMKEDSSLNYPGFLFRFTNNLGENAKILEIEGNTNNNDKTFIDKDEILNKVFVISRINGMIYYYYENEEELTWFQDVSQITKFDTPVTIGCSLDSNGNPWRFFNGTISNVQIIMYDDEKPDIKQPDEEIYARLDNDTLIISKEHFPNDYGNIANKKINWKSEEVSDAPWYKDRNNITKVEILEPICPRYMRYWFAYLNNLEEIKNLDYIDTRYVKDMDHLFAFNKFRTIDISSFNTKNVLNMQYMFGWCSNLETIDISNFNTNKVYISKSMFISCSNLTDINMSRLNYKQTIDMESMFENCNKLTTELTINGNVTTYDNMFKNAATASGAKITVNYTTATQNLVDSMIATKSTDSTVEKGIRVD